MLNETKRQDDTVGFPHQVLGGQDIWYMVGIAMEDPEYLSGLSELAGRLSLLLSPGGFQLFFPATMRALMEEEAWRTAGDFIHGIIEGSWTGQVPVPDDLIRDLLECPDERVQEAAAELREHRKAPVRERHVELRVVR